ncbi:hypothetical protein GTO91_06075 [Heliobacterium undosum]|uniref:Uncharacterized protein n=1 Tax=Heliomicrobium undosum TaxID=121734 RepID=A0A845KZN8_9FIRM|nr:hypothetical protein [Heliomicrobium undosum]MZP29273.1 hypothetical protein [Heliomicrobium undosum]
MASIAAGKYNTLKSLFDKPRYVKPFNNLPVYIASSLAIHNINPKDLTDIYSFTPINDYLYQMIRFSLKDLIPQDDRFNDAFNRFEYFLSLVTLDYNLTFKHIKSAPVGRYALLNQFHRFIDAIQLEAEKAATSWPPFVAGFFEGSLEKYKEMHKILRSEILEVFYMRQLAPSILK